MLTIILTRITLSYLSCMGQKLEELSLQSLRSFINGRVEGMLYLTLQYIVKQKYSIDLR